MITGILTFLTIFAIVGCILYGRKLIKTENDTYEGRTENVVGIAKGYTRGNVFYWKYSFELPLYGRKTKVNFKDYMYLQDNNVIINKAKMSKFGIKLGTVYLFFKKH
ncbi:MAG: DUF3833 family protein [Pelagibacterales bacterium]|nr:DUF3833 family protein [Pelagibacterales bacterium]